MSIKKKKTAWFLEKETKQEQKRSAKKRKRNDNTKKETKEEKLTNGDKQTKKETERERSTKTNSCDVMQDFHIQYTRLLRVLSALCSVLAKQTFIIHRLKISFSITFADFYFNIITIYNIHNAVKIRNLKFVGKVQIFVVFSLGKKH